MLKQCDFGPRVPMTDAHKQCQDYIVAEMKKSCDNVQLQPFTYDWKVKNQKVDMNNVIGEQNWKDAKVRVLLLAHWDSRPVADMDPDPVNRDKPILGANDGASGVAVLLELARALKGRLPKDIGVMYFMTDGEDLGPGLGDMFLGAREFVRLMPDPRPTYGILLDMIGDKDLQVPMEPQSMRNAPDLLRAFYRNASANGLGSTFPQWMGPEIEDDHVPLNQAHIPTIDLIDFDFAPWHTLGDVPSTCSAESLRKVGVALETWLMKPVPWSPRK